MGRSDFGSRSCSEVVSKKQTKIERGEGECLHFGSLADVP